MADMPSILARILARTRDGLRTHPPLQDLKAQSRDLPARRGFAQAIRQTANAGHPALIAELKKASPSAGIIAPDFDPASIAQAYAQAGATCLSVLTDTPFFHGAFADLRTARASCDLPVLCKDFMIDVRQFYAAAIAGADAVLLIAAVLDDTQLRDYMALAKGLQLDVLLEVHNEEEMARLAALADQSIVPDVLGVNNRNLHKFETNIATSFTLAPLAPQGVLRISESGIRAYATIERLMAAGYSGVLVGEHLMRSPDIAAATRSLLGQNKTI